MKRLDLQLFANEAVQGKKLVYLYRILSKKATTAGATLAFTTENGRTKSRDADSTATKDGSIRTPGALETEITATSILKKGDTLLDDLEDALDNGGKIEVWEVNLMEPVESKANKFKGRYFQAYLTELEYTANADEFVEVSLTFGAEGAGEKGEVTITENQQEQAYAFADTPAVGA